MLVPAVSFVVVTLFRKIVNEPRPYEKYDLPPVIDKDAGGKSFPSRHVFSVFVIAVTVFVRNPAAGCILAMIGIMIAVIRVIGGVHTVWDVTAGAAVHILLQFCNLQKRYLNFIIRCFYFFKNIR